MGCRSLLGAGPALAERVLTRPCFAVTLGKRRSGKKTPRPAL